MAESQRCALKGCTAWAFQGAFCRAHARSDTDPALKVCEWVFVGLIAVSSENPVPHALPRHQEQLKLTEMYRGAPALQRNLVVTQASPHPR
jgi:hypothetical protein